MFFVGADSGHGAVRVQGKTFKSMSTSAARHRRVLHICRNLMQWRGAAGPSFLRKIMFFAGSGKGYAGTERGSRGTKTGLVATGIGAVATACTSRSAGMYTFRHRNRLIINSGQKQRRHASGVCLLCDTKIRKKEAVCKCARICPRLSFCIFMRLICGFGTRNMRFRHAWRAVSVFISLPSL